MSMRTRLDTHWKSFVITAFSPNIVYYCIPNYSDFLIENLIEGYDYNTCNNYIDDFVNFC